MIKSVVPPFDFWVSYLASENLYPPVLFSSSHSKVVLKENTPRCSG